MQSVDLGQLDFFRDLATRLDRAPHGGRGQMIDSAAEFLGVSRQRIYARLKTVGWESGRRRRRDAGTTSQDEAALTALGAALKLGVRKNGKATMETPNARSLLAANGRAFSVSNGRLNTLLRQRRLDARSQKQASPHLNMRSLHPNHVHLVDPSLCLLFYLPNGEQRLIRDDEAYKNKPEFIERVGELKVWRYVLVDHCSNVVLVRYYKSKGETQANLYDFLLWCWRKIEGRPFHGPPKLLVWDKGSANTAGGIKNALKALEVETYEHKPGNPRAKGGVEEANNRVEKLFESRLKYEPVSSVEELNAAAEAWANSYNADRIPHYDARLRRQGMARSAARYEMWQRIRQEHLRILPSLEVCRYLLSAEPKTRKVRPDMTIGFAHPMADRSMTYDLRGIDGVYPRAEVKVSPLVYGGHDHQVVVQVEDYKGDAVEHIVDPVAYDNVYGMRLDSPVWGEDWDRQPDTEVEKAGKRADAAAFPGKTEKEIEKAKDKNLAPFGGLDAHTHLGEVYVPEYLDRRGTEMHVPDRTRVDTKPLSHIEAAKILRGRMGDAWKPEYFARLKQWYPEGVPEAEIEALENRLRGVVATQTGGVLSVIK